LNKNKKESKRAVKRIMQKNQVVDKIRAAWLNVSCSEYERRKTTLK
jgi:hypothetical protein